MVMGNLFDFLVSLTHIVISKPLKVQKPTQRINQIKEESEKDDESSTSSSDSSVIMPIERIRDEEQLLKQVNKVKYLMLHSLTIMYVCLVRGILNLTWIRFVEKLLKQFVLQKLVSKQFLGKRMRIRIYIRIYLRVDSLVGELELNIRFCFGRMEEGMFVQLPIRESFQIRLWTIHEWVDKQIYLVFVICDLS